MNVKHCIVYMCTAVELTSNNSRWMSCACCYLHTCLANWANELAEGINSIIQAADCQQWLVRAFDSSLAVHQALTVLATDTNWLMPELLYLSADAAKGLCNQLCSYSLLPSSQQNQF